MIQRIQSIYLILASGLAGGGLVFPLGTPEGGEPVYPLGHTPLLILALAMSAVALAAVFLFTNRPLQARIAGVGMLVGLAFIAVGAILFGAEFGTWAIGFGAFMPVVYVILAWLARNAIRRDEELVRSADRFR